MAKAKHTGEHHVNEAGNDGAWQFSQQAANFGQQFSAASENLSAATTQALEQAAELSKENAEAFVQSLTAASKGVEVLGAETLSFAKQSIDEGITASKALLTVKSPQDFLKLQSDYTRSAFDQFVNQAAKLNDLGMTAMKNVLAPVNGRVTALSKAVQQNRAF